MWTSWTWLQHSHAHEQAGGGHRNALLSNEHEADVGNGHREKAVQEEVGKTKSEIRNLKSGI